MKFYSDVLAQIHHKFYGDIAKAASTVLCDKVSAPGLIYDLGCGSGIASKYISEKGFEVIGCDISESMLAIAREQAPKVAFLNSSFLDLKLKPCKAILACGEIFNYLNSAKNNLQELGRFFIKCKQVVQKVFIFDILHINDEIPKTEKKKSVFDDYNIMVTKSYDEVRKTLVRHIEVSYKGETYEEDHYINLYELSDIINALHTVGFNIQILSSYNKVPPRNGHKVIVATP